MKRLVVIISAIGAIYLSSCKPSPKQAALYNDMIMAEQKKVVIAYDGLLSTFDTYVARKMDSALIEFQSQTLEAIDNIKNITPIPEGETLKMAVLDYLSTYKDVAENQADELVRIYKIPENEFTPEVRVRWDSKYKELDATIKNADKKLKEVQKDFADNFHLTLSN